MCTQGDGLECVGVWPTSSEALRPGRQAGRTLLEETGENPLQGNLWGIIIIFIFLLSYFNIYFLAVSDLHCVMEDLSWQCVGSEVAVWKLWCVGSVALSHVGS